MGAFFFFVARRQIDKIFAREEKPISFVNDSFVMLELKKYIFTVEHCLNVSHLLEFYNYISFYFDSDYFSLILIGKYQFTGT